MATGSQLVGRERELAALTEALDRLAAGAAAFLALAGEPGIGKTRLLERLGAEAAGRGRLVLAGRATEFERDAPYGLWADALDALDPGRVRRLAGPELAPVLPALAGAGPAPERYVVHRAVRALLERLAATRPLVLCLDDVHWADPASIDLLAALARRPPQAPVLAAVAHRTGQAPDRLVAALTEAGAERLALAPLTRAEAAALLGGAVDDERYELSGGNPFYLEQLARAPAAGGSTAARAPATVGASPRGVAGTSARAPATSTAGSGTPDIPAAVAGALAGELAALPGEARELLRAAAVAGEPFEPDLAAEVAGLPEPAALTALDVLLARTLVRPTPTPRRFAFRHPLVRHAVYAAAPPAWRLQAHARAAAAVERRGAGPVERARHVEHAAQRGDREAVALLAAAAERVAGQAPASAAGYLESALRLLPDGLQPERMGLLQALAEALVGAGRLRRAHAVIGETLALVPRAAWDLRGLLLSTQISLETWGVPAPEGPLRRLRAALAELPDGPSIAGFALRMPEAGIELFDLRPERVPVIAHHAVLDAVGVGSPVAEAAALAMVALGHASAAELEAARAPAERAASLLAGAGDAELGRHPQGLWTLGLALAHLDRHVEALDQLGRGVALGHRTGHGYFIPVLLASQVPSLLALGRVEEAIAHGEEAVDAAWASGNPALRLGAHRELALARHLHGDGDDARRAAQEAVRLAVAGDRLWRGRTRWTLAVIEADLRPAAGAGAILDAAGGLPLPEVLAVERPRVWAAVALAQLRRGGVAGAREACGRLVAAAATPLDRALDERCRSALWLAEGKPRDATDAARACTAIAEAHALPLEAARGRAAEGAALAAAGDRDAGVAALRAAAEAFERCGALRPRDEAVRELRRLGVRTWRRGRTLPRDAVGAAALSAREREVAALVAAGARNAEIADELFLSVKTVETHMRNLYAKLGADSRVALVGALRDAGLDR